MGESANAISVTAGGSAFITGNFNNAITFGSGEANETALPPASGSHDVFLARYNPDGTLAWAVRAGGTGSDIGESVAVLDDGSAFVTGKYTGTATFGVATILNSVGTDDVFLARYNPAGTLAWASGPISLRVSAASLRIRGCSSVSARTSAGTAGSPTPLSTLTARLRVTLSWVLLGRILSWVLWGRILSWVLRGTLSWVLWGTLSWVLWGALLLHISRF